MNTDGCGTPNHDSAFSWLAPQVYLDATILPPRRFAVKLTGYQMTGGVTPRKDATSQDDC